MVQLNYLVTTKGVPLRIGSTECITFQESGGCSAVDPELTLILGPMADQIGIPGYTNPINPYVGSTEPHLRSTHGIYLVTRLDGYKVDDVIALIDRSGPHIPVVQNEAIFLSDVNWDDDGTIAVFVNDVAQITTPLAALGWETYTDVTELVITDDENVFGYVSIDAFIETGVPELSWMPGGLAMDWIAGSAYSLDPSVIIPWQVRIADRIAEGASGARGNMTMAYSAPNIHAHHSFVRYMDTSYHFNLAESFYAGIHFLSSTYLVIGDPKTSIVLVTSTAVLEQNVALAATAVPNPGSGMFMVTLPDQQFQLEHITDVTGRVIHYTPTRGYERIHIDLTGEADGIFIAHLITDQGERSAVRLLLQR